MAIHQTMKKNFASILLLLFFTTAKAQSVENIYFNLYTDSLKKGTHNYINVEGKNTTGQWQPLTAKELHFTSDYGSFEGNDLVLPDNPTVRKVTVTASLKSNPQKNKSITIWIKQNPDPMLPAADNSIVKPQRKRE